MLSGLGIAGVVAATSGSILLLFRAWRVAYGKPDTGVEAASKLIVSGAVVAMAALVVALLTDDFSLVYTANHHSRRTPFPFDVATAWAALEGSIVLWGLVLALFTWFVLRRYRSNPDRLGAGALAVMAGVGVFFFGLILLVTNPFEVCVEAAQSGCARSSLWFLSSADAPLDGPGPNPLLQNHFMMAVHPPVLYVGYVGLTVPFSYAISALALGQSGNDWLVRSQRSTTVAWSFLTVGILLGGWWAYEVLSWGGYWAWDPVENASLMPWLVATAFLHSAIVQRRRGMLQAWNFILVISAFALTILGTFLTRSGTINSVHSFTQSAIGPVLLGFLVIVVVGSFVLFAMRAETISSTARIEPGMSREATFLANNLLLTVYAFVVLVGTTYPLFVEAFTGTQVGVGEPFFNRIAVPLSYLLLLVMGLGPITPWGAGSGETTWRRARVSAVIGLGAGIATSVLITRNGWVVLSVALGTYVAAGIVGLLAEQVSQRRVKRGEPLGGAIKSVVSGDMRFWAGQLSHVGVVLIALGMALAANLGQHTQVELEPGETILFEGWDISYESPFQRTSVAKDTVGARLTISRDGRFVGFLEPAANFFNGDTNGVSTPDVLHDVRGDLYATLRDIPTDGSAALTFDTSPVIWLIWLGGAVTALGGFASVMVRRRERVREASDPVPETTHSA